MDHEGDCASRTAEGDRCASCDRSKIHHIFPNHKKIAERHGSHLALDSGGSANGEFIRLDI